jgi:predicted MFS family arabinose efflux permease
VLTGSMSRRSLLLLSLTDFVAANLLAALASGYWFLVGARVLLAMAAGLYVPNANALAGMLAMPSYRGRALAIVNSGITVAIAVGVPLGGIVGSHLGWRMTFVGVAGLSVVALAALTLRLPKIAQQALLSSARSHEGPDD